MESKLTELNKYKLVRILKWLLANTLFRCILTIKTFLPRRTKKTRLFSTTGNISLLNVLTILETDNNPEYEDYLIIECFTSSCEFWNDNLRLANLHKFKKIVLISKISYKIQLLLSNLGPIDEIYVVNHPNHINDLLKCYPNASYNLIDEGCGSLINYGFKKLQNFNNFYTYRYINKIDGYGFSSKDMAKMKLLDINNYKSLVKKIRNYIDLTVNLDPYKKWILFCGQYWQNSGLTKEEFYIWQTDMINNLLDKGYSILFKPHPRDAESLNLEKSKNIKIFNTHLPIELYDLNVLAVVSVASFASVMYSHYWNLPGFSNVNEKMLIMKNDIYKLSLIRAIIQEYTINYSYLLELDVKNMSSKELKHLILTYYNNIINCKNLLSENVNLRKYAIDD